MTAAARLLAAVQAGEVVSGFRVGAPTCEVCGTKAVLVASADAFACMECDVWLDPTCPDPKCLCCWNRERTPSAVLGRKRGRGTLRAIAERPRFPHQVDDSTVCPCGNARTNLYGPPRCPDCKAGGPRHVRQSAVRDQRSAAYYEALVGEIMGNAAALVGGTAS